MKSVLSTCSASIAELRHDPVAVLSAAGGAPVAILDHDEPAAYLVPAATYEWLMERLEDAELAEIVRGRQSQIGDAVEVGSEELEVVAAVILRCVHRRVGVLQQAFGVLAILRACR